ncbi:MAG: GH25 family lysozyme [Verrucomicrobiota bacterium]
MLGHSTFRGGLTSAPQVVNVSHFDPKERQRRGSSYSPSDLSALKRNGARGLIARCGKGRETDTKCGTFLQGTDRQGMLLGSYYFVLDGVDPVWQADRFISRLRSIQSSYHIRSREILLVGDFDSKSTPRDLVRFIDRIESKTGTLPIVYLENSPSLMASLSRASSAEKRRIAQCPYWLALYSPSQSDRKTPEQLMRKYGIWNRFAMWQYGGVKWDARRGRSIPQYYNYGSRRSPAYFGNLDRPLERNAFNGSTQELYAFWSRYAWRW